MPNSDGWQVFTSNPGLSLAISDEAIEVRGFGPFREALEAFGGPLSPQPQETVRWTTSIGEFIGNWARALVVET